MWGVPFFTMGIRPGPDVTHLEFFFFPRHISQNPPLILKYCSRPWEGLILSYSMLAVRLYGSIWEAGGSYDQDLIERFCLFGFFNGLSHSLGSFNPLQILTWCEVICHLFITIWLHHIHLRQRQVLLLPLLLCYLTTQLQLKI